jgi:predicted kinase
MFRPYRGERSGRPDAVFLIDRWLNNCYVITKEYDMDLSKFDHLDIVLICGLYGSGKNEFATRHFLDKDRSRISRSDIRKHMYEMTHFGEKWEAGRFSEENDALVKHIERRIVEHFLHLKKSVLIINTFVTKKSRHGLIDAARQMKKTIGAIFLNRSLEECLERNKHNVVVVPQEVVYNMHHRIELPEKNEGFDEVAVVTFK